MGQIKVVGDAAIVTSGVMMETLKTLAKYNPKALKLFEKEDDKKAVEVFAIGIGGDSNFGKYGIQFPSQNAEGFATATLNIPPNMSAEEKAKYVRDNFGYALLNLNKLEATIGAANEAFQADVAAMTAAITVE